MLTVVNLLLTGTLYRVKLINVVLGKNKEETLGLWNKTTDYLVNEIWGVARK